MSNCFVAFILKQSIIMTIYGENSAKVARQNLEKKGKSKKKQFKKKV
jgi:hypothetical protein